MSRALDTLWLIDVDRTHQSHSNMSSGWGAKTSIPYLLPKSALNRDFKLCSTLRIIHDLFSIPMASDDNKLKIQFSRRFTKLICAFEAYPAISPIIEKEMAYIDLEFYLREYITLTCPCKQRFRVFYLSISQHGQIGCIDKNILYVTLWYKKQVGRVSKHHKFHLYHPTTVKFWLKYQCYFWFYRHLT